MNKDTLLKKEFKKSDVSRIRNLVSGKYDKSTRMGTGYSKKHEEHKEGDTWEENGKKWTIKNGVKQNITKLDSVKALTKVPLCCPKCGGTMKKRLSKKMYKIHGMCFDCVIDYENNLRLAGLYKDYEKKMIQGNIRTFVKDLEKWTKEFIEEESTYVTEQGDIEDWGKVNKKFKNNILSNLKEYQNIIKKHLE